MTLDHSTSVISQPFTILTSWLRLNLIFYKVIIIIAAVSKRKGEDGASFVPRSDGSWGMESTSAPGDRFIFSGSKLCAGTWGSTWMRLEWRSMSGDTSGARCQGKLSYLATSCPLPPRYTQTHALVHKATPDLSFLNPKGVEKTGGKVWWPSHWQRSGSLCNSMMYFGISLDVGQYIDVLKDGFNILFSTELTLCILQMLIDLMCALS